MLLEHLVACRLPRFNEDSQEYTTHPLIRGHYSQRMKALAEENSGAVRVLHKRIKDYYLKNAGVFYNELWSVPTLKQLSPYLEAVHHACRAGEYDAAYDICQGKIERRRSTLTSNLGAYETALGMWTEFFPGGDLNREPQVSDRRVQGTILNNLGRTLMNQGRLVEAEEFYQRSLAIKKEQQNWAGVGVTYRNLACLHIYRGELALARRDAA
jgi:tetratricopeptide (TPR) repeat protein